MRVLLLGADGMLGHDLVAAAPDSFDLVTPPQSRLDITDYGAIDTVFDAERPELVVNATGYTAVDKAESEPDVADAVNGHAVAHLARRCAERDVALVHFSTDYVFSGSASRPYKETDQRQPRSAYARSKALGEEGIEASGARALVIRTQWLFGVHGRSFPRTMLERARQRLPTRVVNDQFGRPTFTRDLAEWTWKLIARGETGAIHAANADTATWFDVARHVFEHVGAGDSLSACTTADYPTPAVRPRYSVLNIDRLTSIVGTPPTWRDALDRFLPALST